MNDMAKGTIVGVLVAVILAGFVVAVLDFSSSGKDPGREHPARMTVTRLGPDGKPGSFFKDGVRDAILPKSQRYDLCFGELRVQRPSMITTDMPTAFCTVTRHGKKGPWRVSTGGWMECQAVCVRIGRK
jgi:hypothetical protein